MTDWIWPVIAPVVAVTGFLIWMVGDLKLNKPKDGNDDEDD